MTAVHQDRTTSTSHELLDQLVAEGHDPDLVTAEIEEMVAAGIVHRPADPAADLVLSEHHAAFIRGHVQIETALRDAPTPPACPSWCTLEPGHPYESVETATGRPFRQHTIETSGDETVDLLLDEIVEVDGSVTRFAPYLVVWVGGNPVEQHLTGPEVLALVQRLRHAANVAVRAWAKATGS